MPYALPIGNAVSGTEDGIHGRTQEGLPAAFVAAGVVFALYAWLFPLYRVGDYIIVSLAALLVGKVVSVMAQGVDTAAPAEEPLPQTGNEAVDTLVSKGQEMLAAIRHENDLIPDEKLSFQMDELERVSGQIFRTVIDKPDKAPQIRRFMDYYLPTTLKMLKGYRTLGERQVSGENAASTRAKVEDAMSVVLKAFEKQLDVLYHDDMLDISTDVEVLEQMLRSDGLLGSGLSMRDTQKTTQQP